jgi:hypothetical protein
MHTPTGNCIYLYEQLSVITNHSVHLHYVLVPRTIRRCLKSPELIVATKLLARELFGPTTNRFVETTSFFYSARDS